MESPVIWGVPSDIAPGMGLNPPKFLEFQLLELERILGVFMQVSPFTDEHIET